jgi:hypothetical protein
MLFFLAPSDNETRSTTDLLVDLTVTFRACVGRCIRDRMTVLKYKAAGLAFIFIGNHRSLRWGKAVFVWLLLTRRYPQKFL